jgi:hypothetical protein
LRYKFTKGGWENVELDKYGSITPTKKLQKQQEKHRILLKNGD